MNMQIPPRRLNLRQQLVLSVFWLPLNAQSAALIPIVIPLQILLFLPRGQVGNAQQAILLGWISAVGTTVSLILPPLFGLASDKTSSKFGRRRPYIAVGTLLLLVGSLVLAAASTVLVFVIALVINQVGYNIATASYQALLPDRVPKEQRGETSGYMGLMTILGSVGSLGLGAVLLGQVTLTTNGSDIIYHGAALFYVLTGSALAIGAIITIIGVHETPLSPIQAIKTSGRESFRRWFVQNWVSPWREPNFLLIFITRFAVMMGLTFFMTFIEYYFANVAQQANFVQAAAGVAILALVGAICSSLVLGIFSDRTKRTPIVCVSTCLMALASLTFVIAPGRFPLWPLGVLFGVGYGSYLSVDWALAIDAMPSQNSIGKDLGLWGASNNLPTVLAPVLGGLTISLVSTYASVALGYRLVFALATLFLLCAAVLVLNVRTYAQQPGLVSTETTKHQQFAQEPRP